MCGIVGYSGPLDPKTVIMNGLKSLEYRGYDSAGVAIFDGGKIKRVRAEGKLSTLEKKLIGESFSGHIGIGHTRWATHGPPHERNAHPHSVGTLSLVHNGIIENYQNLREELSGEELTSDTDSELVAHLVARELRKGSLLKEAVLKVLPRLEGAYSLLFIDEKHPDEMVAVKNGPPLIVGVADDRESKRGGFVVASDVQAIVPYTQEVIYLLDREVCSYSNGKLEFTDFSGQPLVKRPTRIEWTSEMVEKRGYAHFMLKEIYEEPRAVAAALEPHLDLAQRSIALKVLEGVGANRRPIDWKQVSRVHIVACGTSYYAGLVAEYWFEQLAQVPVEVEIASEFRYRRPPLDSKALVIFVSQSGETADTLAALRMVRAGGLPTLSICNVRESSIDREADGRLYMNAGPEIGVASTKAFVSSLAVLNLTALWLGKLRDEFSAERESHLVQTLLGVPSLMETVLAYDKFFSEAANDLKSYRGFLYMGRGLHFPIALEGALKMKELAYLHAEGYAAGEMKHGPLALIDSRMAVVMLAPSDDLYEKTLSNLEEARARGGQIIAIGTAHNERLAALSQHYLAIPQAESMVLPFLEVIPLQLLAYHVACALGHDVDQPRNLAKSVTVE